MGGEPVISQQLAEAERGTEPLKLALLIAANRDVAVQRRVDPRGRGGPEAKIALAGLDDSGLGVAGQLRAHEEERGVEQGDIDTLAGAFGIAPHQGRENSQRGLGARHDVHHGNGNPRRLFGGAVQGHQARHGLEDVVIGGQIGEPASLTEAADRAVHQPPVHLPQVIPAQAEPLHGAVAEVFDDDIGVGDEFGERFPPGLSVQVQHHRLLAGVVGGVRRADAGDTDAVAVVAELVASLGTLDLDDLGTEQGQLNSADRGGDDLPHLDHAHFVERLHDCTRRSRKSATAARRSAESCRRPSTALARSSSAGMPGFLERLDHQLGSDDGTALVIRGQDDHSVRAVDLSLVDRPFAAPRSHVHLAAQVQIARGQRPDRILQPVLR